MNTETLVAVEQPQLHLKKRRSAIPIGLLFLAFFLVVVSLQWQAGAFRSEFGSNPDEAAHYVTGLLFHDYLAAGLPGSPVRYARNYYLHYPRVALGHWPPLFYAVQAIWTIVFTPSRVSVILLIAFITAALTVILFQAVRETVSPTAGICAALLFLSLPIVQLYSQEIMAETLLAVFVLLAFLDFARYLESPCWQYSARFALWFALALLTKGTAIELAGMVFLAILFGARFRLMMRADFWVPLIAAASVTAPWYLLMPGAQHESVHRFGGIGFIPSRILSTGIALVDYLGVVLAVVALAGIVMAALRPSAPAVSARVLAVVSLVTSAWALRTFVLVWDERQLFNLIPILLIFAALAAARGLGAPSRSRYAAVAVGLAALFAWNVSRGPVKLSYAYARAAQDLVSDPQLRNTVFLICGDAEGEGMLISEVAMREPRPGHFVLRATKVLSAGSWSGAGYRLLFNSPQEVTRLLDAVPVGVILIDDPGRQTEHGRMLMKALNEHPEKWVVSAQYAPDHLRVYRRRGAERDLANGIHLPALPTVYGTINE